LPENMDTAGLRIQRKRWEYSQIFDLHKRRFLLRSNALELFLSNGQTHVLVFESGRRDNTFGRMCTSTGISAASKQDVSSKAQHVFADTSRPK